MRRRTTIITAAAVVAAGLGLGIWLAQPSYDDMVKDCQKALNPTATKTHRPGACDGLKQDDYDTLLMAWTLQHAIKDMPKGERDVLDYYDDGSINGSLTDEP
ncbi:hypothetical protein ABZ478_34700 [Streptomyces sp. NPDC005706]|uniref:hypothetical protein n=1 Tax=Streptomyces sp. NPDC005706 TaxID=3157169 RepID=UPI0034084674